MISNSDSLAFALHEMQDAYTAWRKIKDGIMFYMDFGFATKEWFEEFQHELTQIEHFRCITFASSHGSYPRPVRSYFPLLHAKYPPLQYDNSAFEEELSDIYRERRERLKDADFDDEEPLEELVPEKRSPSPDVVILPAAKRSSKRKRREEKEMTLEEVLELSKYVY